MLILDSQFIPTLYSFLRNISLRSQSCLRASSVNGITQTLSTTLLDIYGSNKPVPSQYASFGNGFTNVTDNL